MKKYYYTDPLAAAWMMKNFGMVFPYQRSKKTGARLKIGNYSLSGLTSYCGHRRMDQPSPPRFYIADESLGILVPQDGDMIDCNKIIQRNGIAFMWPEVEEC